MQRVSQSQSKSFICRLIVWRMTARRVTWIVRDFRCTRDTSSATINRVFRFGAEDSASCIDNSAGLDCPYSKRSRWIRHSTIYRDKILEKFSCPLAFGTIYQDLKLLKPTVIHFYRIAERR